MVDDKLYHPDGIWDPNVIYVTVYSKREQRILFEIDEGLSSVIVAVALDVKRKDVGEQQNDMNISSMGQIKTSNVDYDDEENDPNRRCVDLIVLGISYRSLEADVKKCFEAFGELIFCEVIIHHPKMINIVSSRSNAKQMDNHVVLVLFALKTTNLN